MNRYTDLLLAAFDNDAGYLMPLMAMVPDPSLLTAHYVDQVTFTKDVRLHLADLTGALPGEVSVTLDLNKAGRAYRLT